MVDQQVRTWIPTLKGLGASFVIIPADFELAIPEDVFICAIDNELEPVVHFTTALPSPRSFNETALLLDVYRKWGVKYVILGDKPNTKNAWPIAGWYYETLVESFLDRFIPLAYHAVRIGFNPALAPLQPGGDYWDSAFLELLLLGLKRRKMDNILDSLTLTSYGYTFNKPLSWGEGGPERWPMSKPYQTLEDQEDQLGFHNFEWVQAVGQRVTGEQMPVIIIDAGRPKTIIDGLRVEMTLEAIKQIVKACLNEKDKDCEDSNRSPVFNDLVLSCAFSLDTLNILLGNQLSKGALENIFGSGINKSLNGISPSAEQKYLAHYLLLPSYPSGVSDVVLNKVRPFIKKLRPTVGFSLTEASNAEKVSVFPDSFLFKDEQIDKLRAAGCQVEILPESGIEIATLLHG